MSNSSIVSVLIVLFVVLGGWYWWSLNGGPAMPGVSAPVGGGQACTMEAKQCPDGSWVGRTGPNCAFAPCPAPKAAPATTTSASPAPLGNTGTAADDPGLGDASAPAAGQ